MSYQIHFRNCKDTRGGLKVPDEDAFNAFATYSDLLFTGQDMRLDIPGANADDHYIQVMLIGVDDTGKTENVMIASTYLLCSCEVAVDHQKRATSALLLPEQKLVLPTR